MKDILDIIILIMFVIMVALFIINFNKQQIDKYKNRLKDNEKKSDNKDTLDE
ncbi:MAG: hypothetical protein ACQERD_11900 [Campylobacterota bacterium]